MPVAYRIDKERMKGNEWKEDISISKFEVLTKKGRQNNI
jgi:hypothetical protein